MVKNQNSLARASRDIFLSTKALDLSPLGHMECYRIEATVDQSYSDNIERVRPVSESLPIDPRGDIENWPNGSSRDVNARCAQDESNQRGAGNDGRKDS
ncbi:MAG: hypothetical protein Q9194_001722 [Teloschistes cf. exilis]